MVADINLYVSNEAYAELFVRAMREKGWDVRMYVLKKEFYNDPKRHSYRVTFHNISARTKIEFDVAAWFISKAYGFGEKIYYLFEKD